MADHAHRTNVIGGISFTVALALFSPAVPSDAGERKELTRDFVITWEGAASFGDQPKFDDRKLDTKEKRFQVPDDPGDPYYFKSGHVRVPAPSTDLESSASKIAEAVAGAVFSEKRMYTVGKPTKTRFGYYVSVDWETQEEQYTGHVLRMMIDFEKHIIWWYKCD